MKLKYGTSILILLLIALLSKHYTGLGSEYIVGYFADIMAVAIIYLTIKMIWEVSKYKLALGVLTIALIIEFSQLIKNSLFNAIRANTLGQIVIGGTFDWFDILAYFLGILLALSIDTFISQGDKKLTKH
jgi:Protein of unknown function (DUF2809)